MPNDSEDYILGSVELGDTFTARGDTDAADIDQSTMIMNMEFHDWDISDIVPEGATVVLVACMFMDSAAGKFCFLKTKGYSGDYNISQIYNPVANKSVGADFVIPIDPTTRILEYVVGGSPVQLCFLTVKGWWS